MISQIFVNGDSYSAETKNIKVYSKYLEEHTKLPVVNQAIMGSSNDRIFRTTLEYVLSLPAQEKPLVIVGFSFVTREETWVDNFEKYQNYIKDYPQSRFVSTDWLRNKDLDESTMHLIIDQNINKQMVHFYTKLFMLSQTLKLAGIPYLFFSGATNTDFKNLNWNSLNNLKLFNSITQDPDIIPLATFNIPLWAKERNIETTSTGHLLESGHEEFAKFLFEKIKHRL